MINFEAAFPFIEEQYIQKHFIFITFLVEKKVFSIHHNKREHKIPTILSE